jgi:hypothetical protein
MSSHIHRSIEEPIRENPSWEDQWTGPDKGLVTAWEAGRKLAEKEPEISERAKNGELPAADWKGGIGKKIKKKGQYGSPKYLAEWQGLRGENLDIDLAEEVALRCSKTGMTVIFTDDIYKYGR